MIASVAAAVPFSNGGSGYSLAQQIATVAGPAIEQADFRCVDTGSAPSAAAVRLRAATALCLGVVTATLSMSLIGFVAGIIAYDAVSSQDRGSFWAHVPVLVGSMTVITGVKLTRAKWISVGLLFNILSMVLTFCGAVIDGLSANKLQGIDFKLCSYTYTATTVCNLTNDVTSSCSLPASGKSCYCCQVYQQTCDGGILLGRSSSPYYFSGVTSCEFVGGVYQPILWLSSAACSLTFILLTSGVAVCAHYAACLSKVQPLRSGPSRAPHSSWPPIYETALPVLPPPYEDAGLSLAAYPAVGSHTDSGSAETGGLLMVATSAPIARGSPREGQQTAPESALVEAPPPYAP